MQPSNISDNNIAPKKSFITRIVLSGIILVVVALIVTAILYFVQFKPVLKSDDITIGDQTVTKQQLEQYAGQVEQFKKNNPDLVLNGTGDEVASDDLILNAALRYYAGQYGVSISSQDVLAASGYTVKKDENADKVIENELGPEGSFYRVRNENTAYKAKLHDKLLAVSSLFEVHITLDTPYFNGLDENKVQDAYDQAKQTLQNKFLPLFKKGESSDAIAGQADVNYLKNTSSVDGDEQRYYNGPVSVAAVNKDYIADGTRYNNIKASEWSRGELGTVSSVDDKIAALKKPGDYTEVFASQTGSYMIMRLESRSEGKFATWDDFLKKTKEQYAYRPSSVVTAVASGHIKTAVQSIVRGVGSSIFSLGKLAGLDIEVSALSSFCSQHVITYYFDAVDLKSGARISGGKLHFYRSGTYSDCWHQMSGTYLVDNTIASKTSGYAEFQYNCYGSAPYYRSDDANVNDFSGDPNAISGYDTIGINSLNESYSGGHGGWPSWSGDQLNSVGNIYIHYLYRKQITWVASLTAPDSKVSIDNGKTYSTETLVAKPGDTVNFQHSATNKGPDPTTTNVIGSTKNKGNDDLKGFKDITLLPKGTTSGDTEVITTDSYTVTQDDVSDTNLYCQNVTATPGGSSGGSASSHDACFKVPYNYTLKPIISTSLSALVESGSSLSVDVAVNNSGPTKSKATRWVVTQMQVVAGSSSVAPHKGGGNSATDPCGTYFTNVFTTCQEIESGSSVFSTSGSVLSGDAFNVKARTIEDLPVGTEICFALSLMPRSSANAEWVHSAPICVTVGKKPKVQVIGGDLAAGIGSDKAANIITATTVKTTGSTTKSFGSWAEYAVLTNGIVSGMGSGAGYNGGNTSTAECSAQLLTFTNSDGKVCTSASTKGHYTTATNLIDITSVFPVGASTPTFKNLADATFRQVEKASGPITITGGTIARGDWLVIDAKDQTVTITGNINYTNESLHSVKDIPQLIIFANTINIAGNVTNVDAWLIAKGEEGSINTCSDYSVSAPLDKDKCADKLTVNGPIVAQSLYLRRTAGAGNGTFAGDPAEVFNLRPDAYLWSAARASGTQKATSVYTIELPPRF